MSIKERARKASKISAEQRWKLAIEGRFDQLAPEHLTMYKHIHWKSIAESLTDLTEYRNIWITGPACSGINITITIIGFFAY